ncbi:TPA: hypothetical protein ACKSY7_000492 [Pseudomonas aeruginosa]|uniref:hypothetical protein n=1 Tax=Pseudomonas TaxID=286 RepID=UPI0009A88B34|nr:MULTISPECIES: hypothetical protein [Pseudomonas]ELK4871765.1 hypothetical protein [Pseudomonas aeruginosa]MBD9587462.1 hypothetical protein [Pseudomonas sp. PDM03]MDI3581601.1 hypothetical protein [Pseudomonas aeruginosa]MDI3806696.1 hypothetical protein [Pseudomonas aeruginosa]HBP1119467.1 hypothetical protein [Pseudomonas aeruginosa]
MSNSSEQFDVLSNALRVFPEEIFRLNYFLKEVNDPEEGISNIEIACVNVFNQLYGMMCALKDDGHISSIYEYHAITTILCMRHVLQHKAGRIKNNLRDAFKKETQENFALINYGASDEGLVILPFYISISWLQDGIQNSNNSNRLPLINSYLSLELIKIDLDKLSIPLSNSYLGIMPLITEALRQLCISYGGFFKPTGFDSEVYYNHFLNVNKINTQDYAIVP